jgi:hypothetical protein
VADDLDARASAMVVGLGGLGHVLRRHGGIAGRARPPLWQCSSPVLPVGSLSQLIGAGWVVFVQQV